MAAGRTGSGSGSLRLSVAQAGAAAADRARRERQVKAIDGQERGRVAAIRERQQRPAGDPMTARLEQLESRLDLHDGAPREHDKWPDGHIIRENEVKTRVRELLTEERQAAEEAAGLPP